MCLDQITLVSQNIMSEKNISYNIDKCLLILNFILTIPKGHKPCYKTKTTINKNEWFVTIKRRWNGEKGEYGIDYVNKILSSCDMYYRMCLNNDFNNNLEKLKILSETLKISVNGFNNLIITYSDQQTVYNYYKHCIDSVTKLYNTIDKKLTVINKLNNRLNNDKTGFFNNKNITYIH